MFTEIEIAKYQTIKQTIHDNEEGACFFWQAITEAYETKLYLAEYTSFDEFLDNECSKSKTTVYRMFRSMKKKQPTKELPPQQEPESSYVNKTREKVHEEIEVILDCEKRQVPNNLVNIFKEANETIGQVENAINLLSELTTSYCKVGGDVWGAFPVENFKNVYIHNIRMQVKHFRPWAWCPMCGGDGGLKGSCGNCKGKGWLTFNQWRTTPKEFK